jgi:hypothetical protein
MKKLLGLFCLFTLLTAFTCENEPIGESLDSDTGNNPMNTDLLGLWNLQEFNITLNTETSLNGEAITANVDAVSTQVDYILEFTQSSFLTNGNYTYNTNTSVNGSPNTTDTYTLMNISGNGTYVTNGNQITVDGSFFEFDFEGVDTSVFEGEQTSTFSISNNGQTLTLTQNETTTETNAATGTEVTVATSSVSVWSRDTTVNDCAAQAATDQAEAAYNQDTSNEDLCIAYRQALENQISECGDNDGNLQAAIDTLGNCSADTGSTGTLSLRAGTLDIDFVNQDVTFENNIITVSGTSQGGSYTVSFQVTEGDTGTDVIQNFVLSLTGTEFFPSTQGFEDFTSNTTASTGNVLQATFFGLVENNDGGDLSLTQGIVDISY